MAGKEAQPARSEPSASAAGFDSLSSVSPIPVTSPSLLSFIQHH